MHYKLELKTRLYYKNVDILCQYKEKNHKINRLLSIISSKSKSIIVILDTSTSSLRITQFKTFQAIIFT